MGKKVSESRMEWVGVVLTSEGKKCALKMKALMQAQFPSAPRKKPI